MIKFYYTSKLTIKKFLIIICILILYNIFDGFIDSNIQYDKKLKFSISNEDIFKEYNFPSLNESFNTAKPFIDKNLNSILINDKKEFRYNENPFVSVVIPVYNTENLIDNTIKSVQNQDLMNIEIILINDYSSDNSLYIIEQLQKEDPRIKIISNKKNMGIFYSRNIGVLASKGEYIFPIDNDDMFLNKDVLSTITNIAKEGNFDIVEFRGIHAWRNKNNKILPKIKNTRFSNHILNLVLFQPNLSTFPLQIRGDFRSYKSISCYLWAKGIKTIIYKKALNLIGKERYSRFIIAEEDKIAMVFLFNIANSYKFVGKYGIFHISRYGSGYSLTNKIQKNLANLYLVDIMLCFPKNNTEYKNLILITFLIVLNSKLLENIIRLFASNKRILLSCLDRFFKLPFVSKENKYLILNQTKYLKFLDYHFFK